MSLARSPWSEPDPASDESSSWLENVVVTIVFLTAFYCCCRNCVHATFDFVRCCGHCCVRLCRCCICSEESAEDSTSRPGAASDYESLDEERATPAAAPTSAACEQAGPSSASTPSAARMAQRMNFRDQAQAGESGSEALPVAQGLEVVHVIHTNEASLPMSRYQPPRAKVLNPEGHYHPRASRKDQALLECGFCLLFFVLFSIGRHRRTEISHE